MITFKKLAINTALKAGRLLRQSYRRFNHGEVQKKGKHNIVTQADLAANRLIIREIKKYFPQHDFLSEETGLENNIDKFRWIIDPLDGTTNFSIHNPLYCTALALMYKKDILLSVLYAPELNELYFAEKKHGALLNGKKIKVSRTRKLSDSIIAIGRSHSRLSHKQMISVQNKFDEHVLNTRILGSASLNLAYVAAGRMDGCVFVPPEISLWDSLAGILLVQEAGGLITDFQGRPWIKASHGLVISNGQIHRNLLKAMKR